MPHMQRVIGEVGNGKGKLLIAIGGMHGNELAGIAACERVFDILENHPASDIRGKFIAFRGNCAALEVKKRFVDKDLNRIWTKEDITHAKTEKASELSAEHKELLELHQIINDEIAKGYSEVVIIDLHTTSANGGVFIACTDDEIHKKIVRRLHVPVILNLAEDLEGTAMQYFWDAGHVAFAFEGGNHYNPESVNNMESALWLCLEFMGIVSRRKFNNIDFHDRRLIRSTEDLPHFCMLIHHHPIQEHDEFEMNSGYVNFQHIAKGEILAKDKNGNILSPDDGRILMPLYQKQGTDGFFIVQEIN